MNTTVETTKEKNMYVPLPHWHQCPLKRGPIVPIVSLNYYDVCDYCRDTVRQYTRPYVPIEIDFKEKNDG